VARDPQNRAFAPTVPNDLRDPPRFSQVTETTKDTLVLELRKYIDNAQQTSARRFELPTIEKYATFGDGTGDPFSTSATIIRKYPEKLEKLPHIAVMAATGAERRLNIGPPYIETVQDPSTVVATAPEPYALQDGDTLVLRTLPDAHTPFLETITFTAGRFPTASPIGSALAADVARVINEQALHIHASTIVVSGRVYVQVEAGGPLSNELGRTPTEIEVMSSSVHADIVLGFGRRGTITSISRNYPTTTLTAPAGTWSLDDVGRYVTVSSSDQSYFNDGRSLVLAFSSAGGTDTLTTDNRNGRDESSGDAQFFIGLRDDHKNPAHPPKHRYGFGFDLDCQIDVLTSDDNVRTEVVDLVLAFFAFFLEQKYFTFWGRSGFQGQTAQNEYFQIVLNPPLRNASENEFPRPGDGAGKIYVNSFALNVTTTMYIDRELYFPGTNTPFVVDRSNLVEDDTLPLPGDSVGP
jgi:hypothetical protein